MPFPLIPPGSSKAMPAAPTPPGPRGTTPGVQPMAGPPMPPHPTLIPPARNTPHHRASSLAKGKTKKGKFVIPPPQFSGRAKPQTEY